jgi:hypothetical protein
MAMASGDPESRLIAAESEPVKLLNGFTAGTIAQAFRGELVETVITDARNPCGAVIFVSGWTRSAIAAPSTDCRSR